MKSQKRGKVTSVAEVQNVSKTGIWVFVDGAEYFLSYKDYPWFKDATVSQIYNLKMVRGHHLHWPDIDVDLELESLKHPEKYPLTYKE